MKIFRDLAAFAAVASTALIFATPAAAQATRTWISGVGDDVNPCSRTAPCKTWAGAISKTAPNGEIDCLDPGGFGTLTITKSITLDCHLMFGSALASGTNGFNINPGAGGVVNLIGIQINGSGGAGTNGTIGVNVLSGAVLISNSQIYNFTSSASCGTVTGVPGIGVCLNGPAGTRVTIENSYIFNNGDGVVNNPSAGANTAQIEHTVLNFNTTTNVVNNAAGAKTYFNGDSVINSPIATSNAAGSMLTYGNNVMTGTVATMTLLPLQ